MKFELDSQVPPKRREAIRRWRAGFAEWSKRNAFAGCLAQSAGCSGPIIRAHSIQNSRVLEAVAVDGHVYMFEARPQGVSLVRLGRQEASTFTGFCQKHDTELFRTVDFGAQRTFAANSIEQAVTLALRAVAREYWLKLNVRKLLGLLLSAARRNDLAEIKRITFLDDEHARLLMETGHDGPRLFLEDMLIGTRSSTDRLRRIFHSLFSQVKNGEYHLWRSRIYEIHGQGNVAVSSVFSVEFDLAGNRIGSIALHADVMEVVLSVMPMVDRTWVVFVYHKRFDDRLRRLFEQLDSCTEDRLCVAISKMILTYCENAALSPRYVEGLSVEARTSLENAFAQTLPCARPLDEMPDCDFFQNRVGLT
ncbi:MAG: hypothetical protein ABSA97_05490 [Verrucomicrobiia bacterium]